MEGSESVLEAIFQEPALGGAEEILDDDDDDGIEEEGKEDVEMVDAETLEPGGGGGSGAGLAEGDALQTEGGSGIQSRGRNGSRGRGKKKNRRKRKGGGGVGGGGATASIADINRSIPNEAEVSDNSERGADVEKKLESSEPKTQHKKLMDRMRVPVSYDDLLEEGLLLDATKLMEKYGYAMYLVAIIDSSL
ncbi:hypothetical protein B296_00018815 [Ensete ventricosum]|uniref:Uncharacterized protein n=1 Tax=Ensete ventricosum TaxID=4639 RepID=A0A427A8M9_ENSVE|nr:hypothetical protein B296_00018815 [Ensete ventricosum]